MTTIEDLFDFIINSTEIHERCRVCIVYGIIGYQWQAEKRVENRQETVDFLAKPLSSTNETFFVKGFYVWDLNKSAVIFGEQVFVTQNQIVNNDPKAQGKIQSAGGFGDYRRYTSKRD